ncbi:hypothetical protein CN204_13870 [Sinorhizobium meliloti]|nr:hypothetical protein SMRU11_04560 [Sinorhizobium meliloti RU11/001]RVG64437.1 hypothetical protein CN222_17760 [Sinorhizobium meliloti]RVG95298.1 hypothetical protein CN221_13915 [Sinorhizobium meliloti]RVH57305.1 hypothetical protein CN213_13055 [Sinorhizobium meliloti]RVH63433.1 hypothetical protein CN209_18235 [Sinorhizobium meliloti]
MRFKRKARGRSAAVCPPEPLPFIPQLPACGLRRAFRFVRTSGRVQARLDTTMWVDFCDGTYSVTS